MEKLNIAKILKDCPSGMELDCTIIDNVVFEKIDVSSSHHPIIIRRTHSKTTIHLTKYGQYSDEEDYKCVIFPKGKTTWEGFEPPYEFKDGDVVATNSGCFIGIIEIKNNMQVGTYCAIDYRDDFRVNPDYVFSRLATEEEKQKLFQAIKDNGYKWNPEIKTLEYLVKPKFKVGDRVRHKVVNKNDVHEINRVYDDSYGFVGFPYTIHIKYQDNYELVPNKFDITTLKPFESRVLVRHNKDNKWCGSFFSHIDGDFHSHCYKFVTVAGKSYPMCIPYEGNEHLLGTTNDCREYFKTW